MIGEDFRHLPSVHDPDPALVAAREARAARAKAQALAAEEKLANQRERLARADQMLNMLANIAADPAVDISERVKSATAFLDRVLPRVKSVEVQVDGAVQIDHRAYISPSERVAQMDFASALEDYRRRMLAHDQQRLAELGTVREGVLIEQRGSNNER